MVSYFPIPSGYKAISVVFYGRRVSCNIYKIPTNFTPPNTGSFFGTTNPTLISDNLIGSGGPTGNTFNNNSTADISPNFEETQLESLFINLSSTGSNGVFTGGYINLQKV